MQFHTTLVQACIAARRSCLVFMQASWITVQAYIDPIHACILPKPPRIVAVVACMIYAACRVIKRVGNMLMKLL